MTPDPAAVPAERLRPTRRRLRALPNGAEARAVFECDAPEDELPTPAGHAMTWTHRRGASAASSPLLPKTVAALDLPAGPGIAYVAGEARTVQAVRDHLVRDRGWPRRQVITQPFWTPGRRGMD
ncbi:siderophore-interacting protein [Frankia sp. AgB32]|uniref:siderophore-interacting protein n=1 Tax=Frankia sp. AgB32 TaxID=631119 RepID=UPI0024B04B68|nr:siderophore-interacting protein [Frankia sp. AgB32]